EVRVDWPVASMSEFDVVMAIVAGVALFLHGLDGFAREARVAGGVHLQEWLGRFTAHPVRGFVLGAAFTAVVQSSSAISSLTVALVDGRVITFAASLAILLGTNVGTTATAWLVSVDTVGLSAVSIVLGTILSALPIRY